MNSSSASSDALKTDAARGEHRQLLESLIADMTRDWREGKRPLAEDYFNRHPWLWNHPQAAIELIYEEVCLRSQYQDTACWEQIVERFPQWKDQLQLLLECHHIVGTLAGPPRFPVVGEKLGEFKLTSELGRGAQGRVFLARQSYLADRPVVVKVTTRSGDEHVSLAQLQHTNIVPLYSVLDLPDRNLRALCMPYFGGITLDKLLEKLREHPVEMRRGKHLLASLTQGDSSGLFLVSNAPARQFLATASYVEAICWIGICIADALEYAHQRGLLHLDIKPSNVLLAADGQPMLVDFHLAQGLMCPGSTDVGRVGGTPGYMSPEHDAALEALRHARPIPRQVDGRSDTYSLGVTLYEALTGASRERSSPRANELNRNVSAALADLIEKCLSRSADARYPDAGSVGADLRRELGNLPLRGVRNRSLKERWRKWRRRRPHLLAIYSLTAIVVLVAVLGVAMAATNMRQLRTRGQVELEQARLLLREGRYEDSAAKVTATLARIRRVPGTKNLQKELTASLRGAKRLQLATQLHSITNELRALYDVEWTSNEAVRRLSKQCEHLWGVRQKLLSSFTDSAKDSELPQVRQEVETDLLDLAILSAALRMRLAAPEEVVQARSLALTLLGQAQAEFGSSPPLAYEKYLYERDADLRERANQSLKEAQSRLASTAWERYALGRALLREGQFEKASHQLQQALRMDPASLWANFYEGICAYRLERNLDAAIAFTVCVDQAPQLPEAFYNRALTFTAMGEHGRALQDYSQALRLRPDFTAAAFNRGLLHYQADRREAARADFERAVAAGLDPSAIPKEFADKNFP